MDERKTRRPAVALPACRRCGRAASRAEAIEPIGLMEGADRLPLILFQCPCHNTLAIPWMHAPATIRKKVLREAEDYFASLHRKGSPP